MTASFRDPSVRAAVVALFVAAQALAAVNAFTPETTTRGQVESDQRFEATTIPASVLATVAKEQASSGKAPDTLAAAGRISASLSLIAHGLAAGHASGESRGTVPPLYSRPPPVA